MGISVSCIGRIQALPESSKLASLRRSKIVPSVACVTEAGKFIATAVTGGRVQPELWLDKVVEELPLVLGFEDGSASPTEELGPEVGSSEQVPECAVVGLGPLVHDRGLLPLRARNGDASRLRGRGMLAPGVEEFLRAKGRQAAYPYPAAAHGKEGC